MAQTLFDKIWTAHAVADLGEGRSLLAIDRLFLHERTGSIALKSLAESGRSVARPEAVFCTMDHIVDTRTGRTDRTLMPGGEAFIQETRSAAHAAGLTLFDVTDPDQGIVHVISPEQGLVLPGLTLVCPDSHTCTQGAFGALAWGIGSSEAEHALATSTLRVKRPATMRITVAGRLRQGVTAKDLALYLIATYGADGGSGYAVEYAGDAIAALDMAGRMTLCNMAVEFGAFTGLIAPDRKARDYLAGRPYAPTGADWHAGVAHWRSLATDADAHFDADIGIDAADVTPMVSWGTSPQQSVPLGRPVPGLSSDATAGDDAARRALSYMGLAPGQDLAGLAIDGAFIGSCTNARLDDLERAATVLRGRRVAEGVRALCVPGSSRVKAEAEARGLDRVFKDAGFEWRESGCSMCFYAGGESFGEDERVISCTNRNFENRQGPRTRTHLASPETVAASAVLGHIGGVETLA